MLDIYKNDYFNEIPRPYVKCKLSGVVDVAAREQRQSNQLTYSFETSLKKEPLLYVSQHNGLKIEKLFSLLHRSLLFEKIK